MIELALYAAGMALIFGELFVPGGILGLLGGALVIYAIGATWWGGDPTTAVPMAILTVIAIPAMVAFGVRRLSLRTRLDSDQGFRAQSEDLERLLDTEGIALTPLRPSGMARLGDRRESVVAESGLIEINSRVRVVKVEGYRIVVRAV